MRRPEFGSKDSLCGGLPADGGHFKLTASATMHHPPIHLPRHMLPAEVSRNSNYIVFTCRQAEREWDPTDLQPPTTYAPESLTSWRRKLGLVPVGAK